MVEIVLCDYMLIWIKHFLAVNQMGLVCQCRSETDAPLKHFSIKKKKVIKAPEKRPLNNSANEVGPRRFGLPTFRLSAGRSNQAKLWARWNHRMPRSFLRLAIQYLRTEHLRSQISTYFSVAIELTYNNK
jgi:hypothetical protein